MTSKKERDKKNNLKNLSIKVENLHEANKKQRWLQHLPPILDMGENLKEHIGDLFYIKKIMGRKIPFEEIQ
jgi:hypothetical protein